MKQIFALFAIMFLLAGGTFVAQKYLENRDFSSQTVNNTITLPPSKKPTVTINDQVFNLEIAKTDVGKQIGLSAKEKLDENAGMLFPFETPSYYSFWMKDMKFPIDIIFIKDSRIVTIHKNAKPPANPNDSPPIYNPTEPADTVLEINAGLSEKYNFKEGDVVTFENL
jgi:uncharacterized protein